MKLNIGSGAQKMEGFHSVDISPRYNPDFVWDITKFPYPEEWEGCEYIRCDNIIEHLTPTERINVINEFNRIMKPGGILWIRSPWVTMREENLIGAFTDPTHRCYFTIQTSDYWDVDHKRHKWIAKDYGIIGWRRIRNEAWKSNPKFLIIELQKI